MIKLFRHKNRFVYLPLGFAQVFGASNPVTLESILGTIETIAQFMLFAGAFIAVIFITYGGIKWMTARGDVNKVSDARKAILNGIIGAIIVLGVGVIFSTAEHIVNALSDPSTSL